jgi:hypothetical protein
MQPIVFLHTNERQAFAAKIAAYSFVRAAETPPALDVRILDLRDFPALFSREGQRYLREGKSAVWRNDDLQSFTPLRFAVPQVMGFKGRALVVDPDVFALTDLNTLLSRHMAGKAVLARKIVPHDGRPAYYASSVMLLDCERLSHWDWDNAIAEMFSFRRDYRHWMSIALEPEENIGLLEEEWNHFDTLNARTRLLHNTGRATQPWKTGLPLEFVPNRPTGRKWGLIPRAFLAAAYEAVRPRRPKTYTAHPDPAQEQFFFALLDEALRERVVTEDELRREVAAQRIRPDAFQRLDHYRSTHGGRVPLPLVPA